MRAVSFCGIILAAGFSSRMGRDKALLPYPPQSPKTDASPAANQTFLSATIESLRAVTDIVIVVAGANADKISRVAYEQAADVAINPQPELGQFSSLRVGLDAVLAAGRDAAIITLVDRPPVLRSTLTTLREQFVNAQHNIWAVIPQHAGRHGHPFIVGREMIEAFLRAPASANARDILHEHFSKIRYVDVEDPAVTLNINTEEDLRAIAVDSKDA